MHKDKIILIILIIIITLMGLFFKEIAPLIFEKNVEITGIIVSDDLGNDKKSKYTIKIKDRKFNINLNVKNKFEYGDKIVFLGEFTEYNGKRNYGGFDYKLHYKTKNIYGYFKSIVIKKTEKRSISLINIYNSFLNNTKKDINSFFSSKLKKDNFSLVVGFLIGDREELSEEIEENFQKSNLTHVIAVSGSHFTYIIVGLTNILSKIKMKRFSQIVLLVAIFVFMGLTNYTVSVLRSGIMAGMIILGSILKRKTDIFNNILISVLIIVLLNPYAIFDIGGILSYFGVIGMCIFNEKIMTKLKTENKLLKYIFEVVGTTLSANIFIIPIMMYFFNTISFTFIISNLLVTPILSPLLIMGFITYFFKFEFLIKILDLGFNIFKYLVKISANLPFSQIFISRPSIFTMVLIYGLIFLFIFKVRKKWKIIISILLIISFFRFDFSNNCRIHFVDIGQGDCTLIQNNGKNILIDSGGRINKKDIDVGKKILLPYLLNRGITKINYIIVSHFDSDHSEGFLYIMENLKIENAIIQKQIRETIIYKKFIEICKRKKIKVIFTKEGDKFKVGDLNFEIYHPSEELIDENGINNNSILCKLSYFSKTVLFTGDIEKIAEYEIISRYAKNQKLRADILKIAHHGSKTSTTDEFLEMVSPKIALIGCAKNNNFGHPNKEILDKLHKNKIGIFRTDLNGEISIIIDKSGKIVINSIYRGKVEELLTPRNKYKK